MSREIRYDCSGMNPKSMQSLRSIATLNLVCGPKICGLTCSVCSELDVGAVEVEVIEVGLCEAVCHGCEKDSTGWEVRRGGREEDRFEEVEEEEVREVVGAELCFKSVGGATFGAGHYSCVGDEDIECFGLGEKICGTCTHAVEGVQVE